MPGGPRTALAALLIAAVPATAAGAQAARKPVRFAVQAPANGATTAATQNAAVAGVAIPLRGRAPKGHLVRAETPCGQSNCFAFATADKRGSWSLMLDTVVPRSARLVVVTIRDAADERGVVRTRRLTVTSPPPVEPPGGPWLTMIGDSLAEGTAPYLASELPGWRVTTLARSGRRLTQGMTLFDATPLPAGRLVAAFSLFTNDEPPALPELEVAVRASLARVGSRGCVVWATIARPPVGGRRYDGVNRRLRELAADPALGGRLLLVDWARALTGHKTWRREDKVHATPAGYRARAALYAEAARSCPGGPQGPPQGDERIGGVQARG